MALLVAVVAVALAVPMATVVGNDQRAAFVSNLQVDTLSTAVALAAQPRTQWQETAAGAAARTGARVVVVGDDLSLVADSDNSSLDRSFDRPEVQQALAGSLTSDVRESVTLGEDLRYVAAPVVQAEQVVAAVRLSLPESSVNDQVRRTQAWLVVFVLTVVVAAGLVAWVLARSIASPLRRLADVAIALPDDLELRGDVQHGPAEVRAVARALNRTADRLSGILRRTQRVAADASHHLRTPLTGVRLRLEAIEDISADEAVRGEARAATAEVDRLARRIEQVLELARGDAGSAVAVRQPASEVVTNRVEAASGMFAERGVDLTARVEPAVVVRAPAGLVERIVDELLGNALQYAAGRVLVTLTTASGVAELTVADDGPGLPEGERESVFERFRRGRRSVPGGSGLGLALVRESAAALGGSASAGTAALGGLAVTVRLPADAP